MHRIYNESVDSGDVYLRLRNSVTGHSIILDTVDSDGVAIPGGNILSIKDGYIELCSSVNERSGFKTGHCQVPLIGPAEEGVDTVLAARALRDQPGLKKKISDLERENEKLKAEVEILKQRYVPDLEMPNPEHVGTSYFARLLDRAIAVHTPYTTPYLYVKDARSVARKEITPEIAKGLAIALAKLA